MPEFNFRWVPDWEQLPAGYRHADVNGVAVDAQDRVYVVTRYDPRLIVYERDGTFVRSWGEGVFAPRTHGVTVAADGTIWLVNEGDHTVTHFTPEGQALLTLGTSGKPSDTSYKGSLDTGSPTTIKAAGPFNRPTDVAIAPNGELYVADGYGNARIHRFAPDGRLIQSWGEAGTGPGQFNLPHAVEILPDGRVLVCDRENDRIQLFDLEGRFLEEWTHLQRPADAAIGPDGLLYVAELSWQMGQTSYRLGKIREYKHARVAILDMQGNVLTRVLDQGEAIAPGNLAAPHAIAVDSHGDLYIGEVTWTHFHGELVGVHDLQKFERI